MTIPYLYDSDGLTTPAIFLIVILALLGFGLAAIAKQEVWNNYATLHHCVKVGIKRGQTATGYDGKVMFIDDQTIYHCDNGEIQIR